MNIPTYVESDGYIEASADLPLDWVFGESTPFKSSSMPLWSCDSAQVPGASLYIYAKTLLTLMLLRLTLKHHLLLITEPYCIFHPGSVECHVI